MEKRLDDMLTDALLSAATAQPNTVGPAGGTLVPNQAWQRSFSGPTGPGFISRFWLTVWATAVTRRRDGSEGSGLSSLSPQIMRPESGFFILREQRLVVIRLFEVNSQYFIERAVMNHLFSLSCLRLWTLSVFVAACLSLGPALHAMLWFVWFPSGTFSQKGLFHSQKKKISETISQTGLFILPLGSNPFPFTLSVPTGGRQDRHQVSTMNDNTCASAAF